jgi:hypothetical protein
MTHDPGQTFEVDADSEVRLSRIEIVQLYDLIVSANAAVLDLCTMRFWTAFRRRAFAAHEARVLSRALAMRRDELNPPKRRGDSE